MYVYLGIIYLSMIFRSHITLPTSPLPFLTILSLHIKLFFVFPIITNEPLTDLPPILIVLIR